MEKEKYLVSICIPTYNRAPYLKKCLDSLVCQSEFQQGLVEIVVSDNDSTDDTEELAKKYSATYPNFHYYKNKTNVLDQNFPMAILRGKGVLRKLNNDSSIFRPTSLCLLCEIVKKYQREKPVLFFGNGSLRGQNTSSVMEEECIEAALYKISFMITWIGSFASWDIDCKYLNETFSDCQTHLWQVCEYCRLWERPRKTVIIDTPFVDVQDVKKKDVSYGIFRVFFEYYPNIIKRLVDKGIISQRCLAYLEKDLLLRFGTDSLSSWKIQHEKLIYSEEDLEYLIFSKYAGKDYFIDFKNRYEREKFKKRISKLPLIGELLVKLLVKLKHLFVKRGV